ncbi:MAG: UDP-N-acetylmuramoyl-L-alanine--D-glutamate ligase [Candidatus Omnitrophica bacterium]|nr:UDP-N-acetylmuramoyl-L-alanine--D-glutamate ligase [Candidatus Omnitrophota bacterium]
MTMTMEPEMAAGLCDRFGRSWSGRRVTVAGLGKSGAAAAEWLCRLGCRVAVTESGDTPQLRASAERLLALGVLDVELGGHTARSLDEAELLVASPGVPETHGPIAWARARQRPVMSEIDLAFHFCPSPVVAVTGTNGKSTATTLIAEALRASGREAIACGNLGTPFSSVISRLTPAVTAVVEVSSFQLLGCEQFRPRIGVLLNIGANHLDRHRDPEAYLAAKMRLFQRQDATDWAVLNGRDPRVVSAADRCGAKRVWFGENRGNPPPLSLAEETRRMLSENAQAVLQVTRLLGIADPLAWQVLREFRGLEHRMEHVASLGGIDFVNDSKSTSPESLLFALEEVRGDVVVILGGRNKGLDFAPLSAPLRQARVKGLVLIGESRPRLRELLQGVPALSEADTLEQAVVAAAVQARPGTTVLFSPACASFDMFHNFEDRGHSFKTIVHHLAEGRSS